MTPLFHLKQENTKNCNTALKNENVTCKNRACDSFHSVPSILQSVLCAQTLNIRNCKRVHIKVHMLNMCVNVS